MSDHTVMNAIMNSKLIIKDNYSDRKIETKSRNVKYLKSLINRVKLPGSYCHIFDEDGAQYEIHNDQLYVKH